MQFQPCIRATILLLIIALGLAACSSTKKKDQVEAAKKTTTLEVIDLLLRAAARNMEDIDLTEIAPPTRVNQALLPPLNLDDPLADPKALESRFDINLTKASIRAVLMGLVEDTPYNMVIHPDVTGVVTLKLKNVTIPDVMRILRDVYGYEYQTSDSGFHVLPVAIQSQIYHLNYLNIQRTGFSQTRISSGQASGSGEVSNGGSSSSSGDGSTSGSVVETNSLSDLWSEMQTALQSIIGNGEGRSVVVSPQAGTVIVRAMPNEQREVENFLRVTQANLHRQVILEAKIIEVELTDGFQAGINWALLGKGDDGASLLLAQTGGGNIFANGNSLDSSGDTTESNPAAFGGVFSATLKSDNFNSFIELLETQGKVQVLSSPRISTVNNQKAVIKVGEDEYFVTKISSSNVSGSNNIVANTPDITLTPFFSGFALDVTPQIDVNGGVILHIHPTVSEVRDQIKTITINGQVQTLPLALSRVRESDSIVHVRSGQLIVIGGLMTNLLQEEDASTPFLSDLPVIGSLFKHTRKRYLKSELVILLRPIVVESTSTWAHTLKESADRIRAMY